MFTKQQFIGGASRTTTARAYRTVIDWDAVWGAIIIVIGIIVVLNVISG